MGALDNVRLISDRASGSGAQDPLLSALVDKLPAAGSSWPAADRQAWLTMMNNAFDVVYGGASGGVTARATPARARPAPKRPARSHARPAAKPKLIKAGPQFFIDRQSVARRAGGERIMPSDVAGILVDKRGMNGDLATITWADDSMGIPKGLQLDVGIQDGEA